MPTPIKRAWIWIRRFRKRRGYGVHSPFAFRFITGIIYDKKVREAYRMIEKGSGKKDTIRKEGRLLMRLSEFQEPSTILFRGDPNGRSLEYLTTGHPEARIIWSIEDLLEHEIIDLAFFSIQESELLEKEVLEAMRHAGEKSQFIIHGIHHSGRLREAWKRLMVAEGAGITFDLWDAGIILFDASYTKQDYVVNF